MRSLIIIVSFLFVGSAFAQDAEVTNYKSGISLNFSGTRGTDFAEEYFYHDKPLTDRKVVYIKAATEITMAHNERNVANRGGSYYQLIGVNGADGVADSGDEGVIRYKIDGDQSWGTYWTQTDATAGSGTLNPAYSIALTFSGLNYPSGAAGGHAVVGRTGNNGVAVTNRTGFFYWGMLDSAGNEYHTITVADDDAAVSSSVEWQASDGKVYIFVVNPKTPCLTWRATGDAEFYTTPLKNYWLPKIFEQTTYFAQNTGGITCEISNIMGGDVFYRIVTDVGSADAYVDANASTVTLDQDDFPSGNSYLQYYYAGNAAYTKTRAIVKNPTTYPSAAETHGYVWAGDADNLATIQTRVTQGPYAYRWNRWKLGSGDDARRSEFATYYRSGRRVPSGVANWFGGYARVNGALAVVLGGSAAQSGQVPYSVYAKRMALENPMSFDHVGVEINWVNRAVPCREIVYRGYYDMNWLADFAYAYDAVAAVGRANQVSGGMSVIEDYKLRDDIASMVFQQAMQAGSWFGEGTPGTDSGGMWDVARKCAAVIGMFAIPKYSTPYLGTCGLDGNTTTYADVPYPTPLTWKDVFLETSASMSGYPNFSSRLGVDEYNCLPTDIGGGITAWFTDAVDYVMPMSVPFAMVMAASKYHYPSKSFSGGETFFLRSAQIGVSGASYGALYGTKKASSTPNTWPAQAPAFRLANSDFPEIANAFHNRFTDGTAWDINGNEFLAIAYYDATYEPVVGETPPDAPTSIILTVDRNVSWVITWIDNADNETRYDVQYRFGSGSWTQVQLASSTIAYGRYDAPAGQTVEAQVRVVGANATGDWLAATPTTITTAAPAPVRRSKNGGVVRAGGGL